MDNEDSMEPNPTTTEILGFSSSNEIVTDPNTTSTLGFPSRNESVDDLNSEQTGTKSTTLVSEATNTIQILSEESQSSTKFFGAPSGMYSDDIWTVEDNVDLPKEKSNWSIKSICCIIMLLIVLFGGLYVYLNYKPDRDESSTKLMEFQKSKQENNQQEEFDNEMEKKNKKEEEEENKRLQKQKEETEKQKRLKEKLQKQMGWTTSAGIKNFIKVKKEFHTAHDEFFKLGITLPGEITKLEELSSGDILIYVKSENNA
jgi:flagellar biosynthesis GTPase FlhF